MGILSSLLGCRDQATANGPAPSPASAPPADVYTGLRDQIFALTPADMQMDTGGQEALLAVMMETGYPEAVATLVAVADGSVSMYFSSGGGVIGAGEHEPVRLAAESFMELAAGFAGDMQPTSESPLPAEGNVRFFVVTSSRRLTAEAPQDDLGHQRHALAPLFHKGHEVITAVRENAPE